MKEWIPVRTLLSVTVLTGAVLAAQPGAVLASSGAHRPTAGEVVSQTPAAGPLTLRCTADPVGVQDPSVSLVMVACTVAEVAPEQEAVRLTATFTSPSGEGWALDPFCIVPVNNEQGVCGRHFTEPVEAMGGRLTISGTIRPSGQALPVSTVPFPDYK
jgi:hypothetical protein